MSIIKFKIKQVRKIPIGFKIIQLLENSDLIIWSLIKRVIFKLTSNRIFRQPYIF